MKKIFTHSIAILMSVPVFYGGAGINIISYCCNDCRTKGIEALINDNCCDRHKHHRPNDKPHQIPSRSGSSCDNHAEDNDCHAMPIYCNFHDDRSFEGSSCDNHAEDNDCHAMHAYCNFHDDRSFENCCSIERISFDWSSRHTAEQDVNLSPVILNLPSGDILHISPVPIADENNTATPKRPPPVCPRDYLSILTVLLI
ncbi:MAG: hypothetical protein LBG96_03830 [Tannerella sp.]|jgi:hypothetical protein|nr:hypothetical protein [Tannerella sp.]